MAGGPSVTQHKAKAPRLRRLHIRGEEGEIIKKDNVKLYFIPNMLKMFFVTGGQTESDLLDSTEIYDPDLGSWAPGAALSSPMIHLRATTIDNRVLLFGNVYFLSVFLCDELTDKGTNNNN